MRRTLLALSLLCVACGSPKTPQVITMNATMPPQARALLMTNDTLTHQQRMRLDSLFANAKCWRFIRPPRETVYTSACPDSVEAAKLVQYAPMVHATPTGLAGMMAVGDKLKMKAVMIRGFMYVGPEMTPLTTTVRPSNGA